MTTLQTLAFGDDSVWGTAWVSDPTAGTVVALGSGPEATVLAGVALTDSAAGAGGEWRLEGGDATLVASPAGEPVDVQAAEDGIEGWDQLCRVSGRFVHGGHELEIGCLGLRSTWSGGVEPSKFESIRAVSAWFDPDEAMSVVAFRPRKARGHDADALAAAVITPDGSPLVEDPRLSTTYAGDGWPMRAGLELWVSGPEPDQQYPRRATGEAIGARAQARDGEHEVWAEPFRWHSRGRQGAGMYVLARRR